MSELRAQIMEHIPHLRRYARALTKDVDKADDLVQECLTKAIGNESKWRAGSNLRSWLFAILHNQFIDNVRRNAVRPNLVSIDNNNIDHISTPPAQEARLELRELEQALFELPEDQRSVILLVGVEGLTYADAAEIVGVPVGTVRSRLSRAREALRLTLSPDNVEAPASRRPA